MLPRFSAFLFFLAQFVSKADQKSTVSPLNCNPDSLKNWKNTFMYRFVRSGDMLYFIFNDRAVSIKTFFEDPRISQAGEPTVVIQQLYEQKTVDKTLMILADFSPIFSLVGHYHASQSNRTTEFYGFLDNGILYVTDAAFELTFDQKFGERKKLVDLSMILAESNKTLSKLLKDYKTASIHIEIDCNPNPGLNYCAIAQLKWPGTVGMLQLFFTSAPNAPIRLPQEINIPGSKIQFYTFYFNAIKFNQNVPQFEAVLVVIEDSPSRLWLTINIVYLRKLAEKITFSHSRFTIEELFGCQTPTTNAIRELKGIFYEPKKGAFYVFVKRFYLKFEEDLVLNGFFFVNSAYKNNAGYLEFEKEVFANLRFEIERSRVYIKTLPDRSLFVPSDRTFELTASNGKLFAASPADSRLELSSCTGNTLVVEDEQKTAQLFCFFRNNTYALHYNLKQVKENSGHKHHLVESIFAPGIWKQQLMFIFNYLDGSVVFMGDRYFYILKYASFRVNRVELKYKQDEQLIAMTSCLFNKCKFAPEPNQPFTGASTSEQSGSSSFILPNTTKKDDKGFFIEKWTQIMKKLKKFKWPLLVGIILFLLILMIVFLTRKKDLGENSPIEARFYRDSKSQRTLRSGESLPWQLNAKITKIKPDEKSSTFKKSSRFKRKLQRLPAREKHSFFPRQAFSSLFSRPRQVSSDGKLLVSDSTTSKFKPTQAPIKLEPVQKPTKPEPKKGPSKFEPKQAPNPFEPVQKPIEFEPKRVPSTFEPGQVPSNIGWPEKAPNNFEPSESLIRFKLVGTSSSFESKQVLNKFEPKLEPKLKLKQVPGKFELKRVPSAFEPKQVPKYGKFESTQELSKLEPEKAPSKFEAAQTSNKLEPNPESKYSKLEPTQSLSKFESAEIPSKLDPKKNSLRKAASLLYRFVARIPSVGSKFFSKSKIKSTEYKSSPFTSKQDASNKQIEAGSSTQLRQNS